SSHQIFFQVLTHKIVSLLDTLFPPWRHPQEPLFETVGFSESHPFDVQWPEAKSPPSSSILMFARKKNTGNTPSDSGTSSRRDRRAAERASKNKTKKGEQSSSNIWTRRSFLGATLMAVAGGAYWYLTRDTTLPEWESPEQMRSYVNHQID